MEKIIEGVWDCTYCGTKTIRGSIYQCPKCGRQRDDNVTFYMDDPNRFLSDEEAEKLNKNPDWLCSFCDALNSDDNEHCYHCGASREESKLNYFTNKARKSELAERKRQEANEDYLSHSADTEYDTNETDKDYYGDSDDTYNEMSDVDEVGILYKPPKYRQRRSFPWGGAIASCLVLALIAGLVLLFIPQKINGIVSGFGWERVIQIEEYKTVLEDDWSIPPGGRLIRTEREIRSYIQVLSHYETKTRTYTVQEFSHYETYVSGYRDLGNGRFEQITSQRPVYKNVTKTEIYQEPVYVSQPVYDTKYYYEIERWVHKEYITTSGADHSPYWPEYCYLDNEREGNKTETYTVNVYIEKKDMTKTYKLSYDEWASLMSNQEIMLKTYIGGRAELLINDEICETVAE